MTYTAAGALDRDTCIERFAPLVKRIAHHLAARLPASVQVEDLIQAGLIGLADAATRFEPTQGVQFETYASQRIRGAMLDELRANDWLPRGTRRLQRRVEEGLARASQRLGRAPGESEVAAELGVSLGDYQAMLQEAHGAQLLSYDELDEDEAGRFLDRHCADESAAPLARLEDERFRAALVGAIETLPEREKTLMGLYYEQEMNFREIAGVFGVTESRVCQLHTQAVARLRARLPGW